MRLFNNKTYKLVEADMSLVGEDDAVCDQCALSELCDKVSDELNDIDYFLCDEDEDLLEDFTNPIYAEVLQEELINAEVK